MWKVRMKLVNLFELNAMHELQYGSLKEGDLMLSFSLQLI